MTRYLTAQICLNGHLVSSSVERNPDLAQPFCSICGAKTFTACPSCNSPLRGELYDGDLFIFSYTPTIDAYCPKCGKPFPWTEAAIEATKLLVLEEAEFSEQLKASIIESLPDVIAETPRTSLATVRLKKGLAAAGRFTGDAIRQFVIDFGCEFVKRSLEL